ncbi:oligogalacturonate-specific porin KdgM family protein [Agarivorans gilvus]|uniref:Porin n=1 Tax=Agarivorans gilvus TaxID=680279 RepID=A0ABQ1I5P8_9ALTE|nr:oligogalacturonate-specific porin KdgM family protein [Agarivorans gilvus]GGB16762.1 porin [Agarivorans gilvus]
MKKFFIASSVSLALMSSFVSADAIRGEVAAESNRNGPHFGVLKGGYEFDTHLGQFGFDLEAKSRLGGKAYSENQHESGLHETTIAGDYTYQFGNAYLQPRVEYTRNVADDANTGKVALKGGYNFDNGIFMEARYRYEDTQNNNAINALNLGDVKTNRADLTAGWAGDIVGFSVNYIDKDSNAERKDSNLNAKELETKLFLTNLGNYQPYLQYTQKNFNSSDYDNLPLQDDSQVKLGVSMKF